MLSGKYRIAGLKKKGYNGIGAMLNNNVVYHGHYVQYTLHTRNNIEEPNLLNSEQLRYACLPLIYTDEYPNGSVRAYKNIEIILNDGTIKRNLDVNITDISRVRVWYPEETTRIRFRPGTIHLTTNNINSEITNYIKTLEYIETSNFTSTKSMFEECRYLESINTACFNLKNVTDASRMFYNCGYDAEKTISLHIPNWNVSKVTNMELMFFGCRVEYLDVSGWDVSNVTNMIGTFSSCSQLKILLGIETWNTTNVTDMLGIFTYCRKLTDLHLNTWNTSKVTNMDSMFQGCTALTSLDVSSWNTSNVTDMSYMFNLCESLTSLDLSNFDTYNVTDMSFMFENCESLTSLNLRGFHTPKVTATTCMFNGCKSLNYLNLWNFDTRNVTNSVNMFLDVPSSVIWDWIGEPENVHFPYSNFTLTEEETGFSGTFPWNQ